MKAGVLKKVNDIQFLDVADPALEPGDMLLRVKAATICGTDIRIYRGKKTAGVRYPSILGHEFAAEVVDNGGHRQFSCDQPIVVCPQFACGHCTYCIRGIENLCLNLRSMGYEVEGAFAEYVRIPKHAVESGNIFNMPEVLTYEQASLAEPLACVMNGQSLVGVHRGDTVLILGAGPIGLLHLILARQSGALKIFVSEPNPVRREAALAAGADHVIDPMSENLNAHIMAATEGLGVDVAICAIGIPTLANDAITLVRNQGRVSLFAGFSTGERANIDVNAIHYKELSVTGAFSLTRFHFANALKLLSTQTAEFKALITHRYNLATISDAIATAEQGHAIKVAISGI